MIAGRHAAGVAMVLGLGLLAACAATGDDEGTTPREADVASAGSRVGPLGSAFAASAARAGVPRDLLVAIAKVEDGLTMPAERVELDVDNDVPSAGPLQLRRGRLDTLKRGAELSATSELELRRHADLALEAGALVLAELGERTGARADDLASFGAAIAEMSGFADEPHRDQYVHQVFATLARGGSFEARGGETIHLPPHDLPPSLTIEIDTRVHSLADAEYSDAEWIPTSCTKKCDATRDGNIVQYVVIHDTEGGWNASVATLQNDPNKSVQYIVGEDGRVAQFLTEEKTAWHAGNYHYNQRSIGIEHVGYSTKPFPEAEYASSARLVDYLLTKYELPRDRAHVIGHDQIPNGNKIALSSEPCADSPKACQSNVAYGGAAHHTDPGIWEWPTFMVRFGGSAKCNDVTEILNCSNDKRQAFRCVDGRVEVRTCIAPCEVQPDGVEDLCVPVTTSTDVPVAAEVPPPAGSDGRPREPPDFLPPTGPRPGAEDSGCSAAPGGASRSAGAALLLGLSAALRAVRRRKGP